MIDGEAAVAAWEKVLGEMEEGLSVLEMRLVSGGPVPRVDPFTPPEDLPPLPRHLTRRAASVLARTRRVEEEIALRAEATRRQLASLDQQRTERRPVRASFFDQAI